MARRKIFAIRGYGGDSGGERARYPPSTAIKTKVDEPRNVDRD